MAYEEINIDALSTAKRASVATFIQELAVKHGAKNVYMRGRVVCAVRDMAVLVRDHIAKLPPVDPGDLA